MLARTIHTAPPSYNGRDVSGPWPSQRQPHVPVWIWYEATLNSHDILIAFSLRKSDLAL
jgi:hypothetical protein